MAKAFSVKYSNGGIQLGLLILRVTAGFLIMFNHGLTKIEHFSRIAPVFADPLHIGHYPSFILVIFAEMICGPLLILGLLTRWASIPLIIEMLVLIFMVENGHGFAHVELPIHFLVGFILVLIMGPGRISVDGLISRK